MPQHIEVLTGLERRLEQVKNIATMRTWVQILRTRTGEHKQGSHCSFLATDLAPVSVIDLTSMK